MDASINGFYAAYLTGSAGQGFALLALRDGTLVGADSAGIKFDGTYSDTGSGFAVRVSVSVPANAPRIQGGTSGPQGDTYEVDFQLPQAFLSEPFIRINSQYGPVNARLTKLRDLHD